MVIGKSQSLRCLRNSELHAWMSELVGYLGVWVANMGGIQPTGSPHSRWRVYRKGQWLGLTILEGVHISPSFKVHFLAVAHTFSLVEFSR